MKLGAGVVRRVLRGALVLGLAGAAQAGVTPLGASAAVVTRAAAVKQAAPAASRRGAVGRPAVFKPKARNLKVDPRENAWRSRFHAHPVSAPTATAPVAGAATSRRRRAAAAREAFRQSGVSACSGTITADTLYSCQTPSATGTDTYTLKLPAGPDVLVFQATDEYGNTPPITVTAPDATVLSCQQSPLDECATSQQGTYAVAVAGGGATYTLEFTALLSEGNCPAISLSFSSSPVTGSLTAGQTGDCYSFTANSGDTLYTYEGPYAQQVDAAIFDATGNLVCAQVMGVCTLTGSGPYRVLASDYGQAESFEFQLADLTGPAGCAPTPQQDFGQAPTLSADLCSTLDVTSSGSYQIYSVDNQYATQPGTLYAADGGQACTSGGWACQLAPGAYSYVQDYLLDGDQVGTVFIDATQTTGCAAASDTSFSSGDATGSFAGPGEELCRTVPTQAGLSDYLYSQPVPSGSQGQVLGVVDATGTQMCPNAFAYWSFGTCALTGTAPFQVVLVPSGPNSNVRLLIQRTDSTAGCASWPRSSYGNAAGAHVRLTRTDNAKCFAVPAAGRPAAELVEDADLTDGASAALTINDPSGAQLCVGNGYPTDWAICDYKPGVAYTALLVDTNFPSAQAPEEYWLARRDLTGSAACSSPASTSPGGPTTSFTLGSSVAAQCFRVSASKADNLMFDFRASAPTDSSAFQTPSALLLVTNGAGSVVCAWSQLCTATGSAGYQAIALTLDYTDVAIAAHLNPWVVATAAGWAPACLRNQFSTGATSAAVSGTLTDRADVYCAVVSMQPNQQLSFYGSDTAVFPDALSAGVFPASPWGGQSFGICAVGGPPDWCDLGPVQQAGQALLIVTPSFGSQDPISFDMQAVCRFGCASPPPAPTFTSISPAAQAAGPGNTVVLTGTGLDFATPFLLMAQDGSVYSPAAPVTVNAAGTRLTLLLDTTQVPTGAYDVSPGSYCSPAPCPNWLLNAYTVTSPPAAAPATRFVPLPPARVLDTRTGLGARRARVRAHGTVTFKVGGRAGVPASGVAAVVLDVSAVAPTRAGFLTAFTAGRPRPPAETAAFAAQRSSTGLVDVPLRGGRASVYNGSSGRVDVTADVLGYDTSTASAGTGLTPVGPVRIRASATVRARHALILKVAGVGGIPASGAQAVALDVTATGPAKAGSLIAYADGTRRPDVTSLTFAARADVTELVIARVSDGKVDLYNSSGGTVRLSVDADGYYSAAGSAYHPVGAVRVMDTRAGFGGAGGAILPHTAAKLEPLWKTLLPPGANVTAVALNVTAVGPRSAGTLSAFTDGPLYEDGMTLPNSTSLPGTPNIAFQRGQTQSNLVIVPIGALADFYNGSNRDLAVVADLEGYYTS